MAVTADAPPRTGVVPGSATRARTPTVLQMQVTECGAASLAMVLAHYGRWVALEELRERCGASRDGTTASDLAFGVATDAAGNVYLTGSTQGSLGGPNRGCFSLTVCALDAWVAKLDAASA